jgi:integrase
MPRKRKSAKPSSLVVQFRLNNRVRTISLKSYTAEDVRSVKGWVRRMVRTKAVNRDYDLDVCHWLAGISDEIHAKLAAVGLVEPRKPAEEPTGVRLESYLDSYIAKRVDAKPSSRIVFERARNHLVAYFGAGRELSTITEGDAEDYARHLAAKEVGKTTKRRMAEATVRKMCGVARQFFKSAVKRRLIAANPFEADSIKTTVNGNAARFKFVTVEESRAVLAACPDAQWRLIFALSRWGGLRCPSEHLALRWSHVDWVAGRLTVPQPKTAHHGKPERIVPLFPELRPYLEDAFEPGAEWVITRYRAASANLRTQFERILKRAGLTTWPRLFHNLRATRQTELSDRFPQHVVSAWMGNSERIAERHYLHVTDVHFVQASGPAADPTPSGADNALNATRIPSFPSFDALEEANKKPLVSKGLSVSGSLEQSNHWSLQDSNL